MEIDRFASTVIVYVLEVDQTFNIAKIGILIDLAPISLDSVSSSICPYFAELASSSLEAMLHFIRFLSVTEAAHDHIKLSQTTSFSWYFCCLVNH